MDTNDRTPLEEMATRGWVRVPGVLEEASIASLGAALEDAEAECASVRKRRGMTGADGSAHHLAVFRGPFLDFLARTPLDAVIRDYFGGPYILNSYGASVNRPEVRSYLHTMHRDVRSFTRDIHLMLNMLVMLDDFTVENGATYFLSGSHQSPEPPEPAVFEQNSERATGRAGDIVLFDSRLWHAAAPNQSTRKRRALTLTFTPPFIKPQFDYPRALGYSEGAKFDPSLRAILGYDSRIPASLEEWYQPPEDRFYKPGQG